MGLWKGEVQSRSESFGLRQFRMGSGNEITKKYNRRQAHIWQRVEREYPCFRPVINLLDIDCSSRRASDAYINDWYFFSEVIRLMCDLSDIVLYRRCRYSRSFARILEDQNEEGFGS